MVTPELGVTVGIALTVTVTVAVLTQPFDPVPVTVYVVVAAGVAVTLVPVVALNAVAGDQIYVIAPLAVNTVEEPLQIATLALLRLRLVKD